MTVQGKRTEAAKLGSAFGKRFSKRAWTGQVWKRGVSSERRFRGAQRPGARQGGRGLGGRGSRGHRLERCSTQCEGDEVRGRPWAYLHTRTEMSPSRRSTFGERGVRAVTKVAQGHPPDELLREARAGAFDAIVGRSAGAWPCRGRLLGSVSRRIVHDTPCSVIVAGKSGAARMEVTASLASGITRTEALASRSTRDRLLQLVPSCL